MFFLSPVRLPSACVRSFTCVRVRSLKSHKYVCVHPRTCIYICVRAHTCAFVHVRLRSCPYVCVRALASAFVHVRASVFVCIHIIKSPDASARIISDASGRVFRSRTFEVYYTLNIHLVQKLLLPFLWLPLSQWPSLPPPVPPLVSPLLLFLIFSTFPLHLLIPLSLSLHRERKESYTHHLVAVTIGNLTSLFSEPRVYNILGNMLPPVKCL